MREVRDRQYDLAGELDRLPGDDMGGSAAAILQTFTEATYPTVAAKVYACHPCVSTADDTEGAAPVIGMDTTVTIYAANLGTRIPASGTNVVACLVGGRWCFVFNG